jgi:hypothetical protein
MMEKNKREIGNKSVGIIPASYESGSFVRIAQSGYTSERGAVERFR